MRLKVPFGHGSPILSSHELRNSCRVSGQVCLPRATHRASTSGRRRCQLCWPEQMKRVKDLRPARHERVWLYEVWYTQEMWVVARQHRAYQSEIPRNFSASWFVWGRKIFLICFTFLRWYDRPLPYNNYRGPKEGIHRQYHLKLYQASRLIWWIGTFKDKMKRVWSSYRRRNF